MPHFAGSASDAHVSVDAVLFAERVAKYAPKFGDVLRDAVALAAEYHDLGKLDDENQAVLESDSKTALPLAHWDAGSAHLLCQAKQDQQELTFPVSAALILAHHEGLVNLRDEMAGGFLRVREPTRDGRNVQQITDRNLTQYVQRHREALSNVSLPRPKLRNRTMNGMPPALLFRLALSCLVDADHSDTALNYRDAVARDGMPLNPDQRLATLNSFVRGLGHGKTGTRANLRDAVYQACRDADTAPSIYECDSPVGTGKTTAVMAHLLQVACERRLRRVFVVLPFTNIINQSVKIYRKALIWPGENSAEVVAAHHNRIQFECQGLSALCLSLARTSSGDNGRSIL